ncbi:MAG TPA: type I glyceraldehyde-3-phosphate dehydrogenase [Candidatus Babeliales bacterium]|nr:type I glyceraldehyde-3-phosphate dehydrogenase [Candidatus Babeliales bacterium]
MKTRIAINGFGRIGRNAFKIAFERPDLEIVAINDLTDTKTLAHLLKHDSNYGTYQHDVNFDEQNVIVNGQPIRVLAVKDPTELPWKDMDIDVVIESTGLFTKHDDLKKHLQAGAKKVILSAPEKDDTDHDTYVIGVNEQELQPDHQIISNASCTTNCITPVAAVIEAHFGIEKAMMTTVHSYTASQRLQDAPAKDLREARAAAENIVPTTTGASIAAAKALPALEGIFGGLSIRVPTPVVSLSDFAIVTKRAVTAEEVNEAFKKAATEPFYQGVLAVTEEELVSSDFIGNSHSAIVDLPLTNVVGGNLLKVVAWYDNEWGYSNRLVELTADAGKLLNKGNNMSQNSNMSQPAMGDDNTSGQSAEDKLQAPTTDDFLPSSEPHNMPDAHQPVEGHPGLGGPGNTLPEQQSPSSHTLPDSDSPMSPEDKPHEI